LSYYWKHDVAIKHIIYNLQQQALPTLKVKTFIWRFTFGQHNKNDCGSGFRFLVRMTRTSAKIRPDNIREMSERQRIGDKRASDAGRVPDDVWEFPRVVGNAYERKSWHPTQHPEALMQRIICFSTDPGDKVLDLYSGTGTTLRVCKRIGRDCTGIEIDPLYCKNIERELNDN
jgi:site-specific DNA-methyltransferase (adenine-specific)